MTKLQRLTALAEVVRDCNDCTWNGDDFEGEGPYPHNDLNDCFHCMAKHALGDRTPGWIDGRVPSPPDGERT